MPPRHLPEPGILNPHSRGTDPQTSTILSSRSRNFRHTRPFHQGNLERPGEAVVLGAVCISMYEHNQLEVSGGILSGPSIGIISKR
jgi:hypothetical protein